MKILKILILLSCFIYTNIVSVSVPSFLNRKPASFPALVYTSTTALSFCFYRVKSFFPIKDLTPAERIYVNSEEDFYLLMLNHVKNVERIALFIWEQIEKNPQAYKSIFNIPDDVLLDQSLKNMMVQFIRLHDASKVSFSKDLLIQLSHEPPLFFKLYSIYGRRVAQLNRQEKKIIQQLNEIDKKSRKKFIQEFQLSSWQINFIDSMEKLADGIDRGMNPVTKEEMNRHIWKESERIKTYIDKVQGSSYKSLRELNSMNKKLNLAIELEKNYPNITVSFTHYHQLYHELLKIIVEIDPRFKQLTKFEISEIINDYAAFELSLPIKNERNLKSLKNHFRLFLTRTEKNENN